MGLTLQNKIDFFSELISNSHRLFYWCYDANLNLKQTGEDTIYDAIFSISGCKDYLKNHLNMEEAPLVLTDSTGLMWIATFEGKDNFISRVHVIGPAFIADFNMRAIEKILAGRNYSVKLKKVFVETLHALPILPVNSYYSYGLMLHYTITGNQKSVSDFHYQAFPEELVGSRNEPLEIRSKTELHGTWSAEQELMRHIEEGDLNYKDALGEIAITGSSGDFGMETPLQQAKSLVTVFVILCSRAAMRAGLSPEIAYTLSDFYMKSAQNAESPFEAQAIGHTMYQDYVVRVHNMLQNTQISRPIQESCNYIQLHSSEKLAIGDIAAQVGYAEYYFSKKFKKEMGKSVKDYIKETKINRAKLMLKAGKSIPEITDILQFSSQSYFTEIFRKLTGTTPSEYQKSCGL